MATKLKNFLYNPVTKITTILLILASAGLLTFVLSQLVIVGGPNSYGHYYQTDDFNRSYSLLSIGAIHKHLILKDEATILEGEQSVDEQNHQIKMLRDMESDLRDASGFMYVLENVESGEIITNIPSADPVADISQLPTSLQYEYGNVFFPEGSEMRSVGFGHVYDEIKGTIYYPLYNTTAILESLNTADVREGERWRYYTAIADPIPITDLIFYDRTKQFEGFNQYATLTTVGLILSCVLAGVLLIFLLFIVGKRTAAGQTMLVAYDEVPQEVQTMITIAFLSPLMFVLATIDDVYRMKPNEVWLLVGCAVILASAVLVQYCSLIRLFKAKQFMKKLVVYRLFAMIGQWIQLPRFDQVYKLKILIWIGVWLGFNLLGFVLLIGAPGFGLIVLAVINSLAVHQIFKLMDAIKKMMTTIHNRRNGSDQTPFEQKKLPLSLQEFAADLDALQEGLDIALEERMKGELLKTELITNVTHDLKNPLTSIISYVALLKNKHIEDAETAKYIDVLDEKANRLKGLIDQLVDASKASSGNVTVNLTTVELIQLTHQLCGEFEDKLASRSLSCVVPETKDKYYVEADPMVLYRILENLMSNVSNYALENTRVYLEIKDVGDHILYGIKNISKEPLNMSLDDLSRRFVRGDSSRNTEGSGLGISIALSLAKLMSAQLSFDLDGDLFKAQLRLKKMPAPKKVDVSEDDKVTLA